MCSRNQTAVAFISFTTDVFTCNPYSVCDIQTLPHVYQIRVQAAFGILSRTLAWVILERADFPEVCYSATRACRYPNK